jgi:hypothetical protein
MGYDLVVDTTSIQTNGTRIDDIDFLWAGQTLEVSYRVDNQGNEAAPEHYDFLSITDNALTVEYEDWAKRDPFDGGDSIDRTFTVGVPLAAGIHWVFVTADAGPGTSAPASARVVVVATDEAERLALMEELRGANGMNPA